MTAHTRLSSKGQIVIPKDVRDRLRWKPGMELEVVQTPGGITVRATAPFSKTLKMDEARARLDKLFSDYKGPIYRDADWNAAIDRMFREEYRDE